MITSTLLTTTLFIMFVLFAVTLGGFIGVALYFLPVLIALYRKHNALLPIVLIDLFLGWTFLGWLAALLWAINKDVKE